MKILVVEDDTMIREGLSEFLSESGYTMVQAKDGKEALEKFNTDIHLVILDRTYYGCWNHICILMFC